MDSNGSGLPSAHGDASDASTSTESRARSPHVSETVTTDISATRWAFLERFFYDWFNSSEYQDRWDESPSTPALAFDAFRVYFPLELNRASQHSAMRLVLGSTMLVGCMFHLDKSAWWFVKERFKPWFAAFQPPEYDQQTLVPKMLFLLRRRFDHRDDHADALRLLIGVLSTTDQRPDDRFTIAFEDAKERLFAEYGDALDGFQLPISFEFAPEVPSSPAQLKSYLEDVVTLVQLVTTLAQSPNSLYLFRLEDIQLKLYMQHLNGVQEQLRRLLTLGVPVNIQLRQVGDRSGMSCSTDDCVNSSTMYAAFAQDPASLTALEEVEVNHTLDHRIIYSSPEFWSALAFTPNMTELAIHQQFLEDKETRTTHAKWLSYSLSHTRVRSLSLTMFEPTVEEMDMIQEVAQSADPTRLLGRPIDQREAHAEGPQIVVLKPDALIETPQGDLKTLSQLSVPTSWHFPVVEVNPDEDRVEFVIPGYKVCSTTISSVHSLDVIPARTKPTFEGQGLRSLAIYSDEQRPGVAARFVELFGRSLRRFRWAGDDLIALDEEPPFDDDLASVLSSCPLLETMVIKERKLHSLDSLTLYCETRQFNLRSLTLTNVSLRSPELVKFFNHLANPRNQLSRKLQHLSYESAFDDASIEAALAMLRTNRTLSYVNFGISGESFEAHQSRFNAERSVLVRVDRLQLRAKLAFLSVVQSQESDRSISAVSRLDSGCASLIFECVGRLVPREILIRAV